MKYKVGDVVKIKTWKELEKEFGLNDYGYINCKLRVTPQMENNLNKRFPDRIVKIKEIVRNDEIYYRMENVLQKWDDEMVQVLVSTIDRKEEIEEPINSRFEILDIRED